MRSPINLRCGYCYNSADKRGVSYANGASCIWTQDPPTHFQSYLTLFLICFYYAKPVYPFVVGLWTCDVDVRGIFIKEYATL